MKEEKTFKILNSYLLQHKKEVFVFILFSAVFAVVFYLYELPVDAVLYACVLCFFLGIIVLTIDFFGYLKKIKLLRDLQKRITLSFEELPEPQNLLEQEFTKLLYILHEDKINRISAVDNAKSDLADYYTLWAHQIKTPIAAMRLLLQSGDLNNTDHLSMELFKIEQYVEMVLQYIRLESSSSDFVFKEYNLDDIVKQAVRKYAKIFIHKKIKLNFTELNCVVLSDEKWMIFVIEQILSNALKYTNKGEISIYMENNQNKTLVIEDTGMGIKGEDLPRVFENGFTGYNGRADKKSTGIGLYLCKKVLNKLSHAIKIESEAGKGTKIKINFDNTKVEIE